MSLFSSAAPFIPPPAPPAAPSLQASPSPGEAPHAGLSESIPLALLQPGWGLHSGFLPGSSLPPSSEASVPLFGEPSPLSDYSAVADQLLRLQAAPPASPPALFVEPENLLPVPQAAEAELPQQNPVAVAAALATVGDTTQLTTAIANFLASILAALSQLLADLQAALTANPALALLLVLPLFLLILVHHGQGHGYGYGGHHGGGYHGRLLVTRPQHGHSLEAMDVLARHVLIAIQRWAQRDAPPAILT